VRLSQTRHRCCSIREATTQDAFATRGVEGKRQQLVFGELFEALLAGIAEQSCPACVGRGPHELLPVGLCRCARTSRLHLLLFDRGDSARRVGLAGNVPEQSTSMSPSALTLGRARPCGSTATTWRPPCCVLAASWSGSL